MPHRTYMAEVHMGNDRDLFSDNSDGLPLMEGRMLEHYDYRAKAYRSGRGRAAKWLDLPFGSPGKSIIPQWRIPKEKVPVTRLARVGKYRIGFCDVASSTNERGLI